MSVFVVTAELGKDYYDCVKVEAADIQDAITEGAAMLGGAYANIISVVRIS